MLVTVGVDTHTDVHVAAVLDPAGRLLETKAFPATTRGYAQLATWAESFGQVDKVGMEGTGSFGAGLLRFLADYGLTVIEFDRRNGKSDPLDAESAARAVQSGRATGTPKSRDAQVEMIRVLRVARRGAMKARIQAGAQLDALVVTAPEPVRAPLRKLTSKQRIRACAALRPSPVADPGLGGQDRPAGTGPPLAGTAGRDRRPRHPADPARYRSRPRTAGPARRRGRDGRAAPGHRRR
jgi:transposase